LRASTKLEKSRLDKDLNQQFLQKRTQLLIKTLRS